MTDKLNLLYQDIKHRLQTDNIDSPGLEARVFLKEALGVTDADLIAGKEFDLETEQSQIALDKIKEWIDQRLKGVPVSKILGKREFWGLSFKVTSDVLDPRPDTETLIEAVLKRYNEKSPHTVLDLGTGSGCIIISLLSEWSGCRGVGVDVSEAALNIAQDNAKMHHVHDRLELIQSNWEESITGKFDVIVSNPPYIPNQDIPNLSPSVKNYDPILALEGGDDGLACYKIIIPEIKRLLNKDGFAFLEVGYSQAKDVSRLVEDSGLFVEAVYPDIAGIPRVVEISFGEK